MANLFNGSRRSFLQLGIGAMAGLVTTPVLAGIPRPLKDARSLALLNLHTDERLRVTYWKDGKYDRAAMEKINHILRDHYTNDEFPINARLIDLLYDLQHKCKNDRALEIVSCYRSPKTNLRLASYSDGVAKNSFHTKGMAIDIRMSGTPLSKVHKTALAMRRGGVGYYADSQFVHVDVGPVRRW